jgi:hypothetical protein
VGGRYIAPMARCMDVRMDACVGRYVGGLSDGCLYSRVSGWAVGRRRVLIWAESQRDRLGVQPCRYVISLMVKLLLWMTGWIH